jgi:hypothetical protein
MYVDLANKRIGEPLSIRQKQLTAVFEKISPGEKIARRNQRE